MIENDNETEEFDIVMPVVINDNDVELEININDKRYYQIQEQLFVKEKRYCVLAVCTPKGLKHDTIFRVE